MYDPASRGFDAIGLGESQIGLDSTVSEQNNNLDVTHASMQEIAERTGGKAFYNRNEIGNAIVASMNDGGTYYTLGLFSRQSRLEWQVPPYQREDQTARETGCAIAPAILPWNRLPSPMKHKPNKPRLLNQAMDISAPVSTQLLFQARVLPPSAQNTKPGRGELFDCRWRARFYQRGDDDLQHASINCAVEVYSEQRRIPSRKTAPL